MLKVYKKSGRKEDFLVHKISTAIERAGDASHIQLSQKEIDLITNDVVKTIIAIRGEDGLTSAYEIRSIVTKVLRDMGFGKVSNAFYECR